MRSRADIIADLDASASGYTGAGERTKIQTEVLLDCRDLLQRLVEKKTRKQNTVEVETTDGPMKILINGNPIEEIDTMIDELNIRTS